jgi:uncharacterized protein
MHAFDAALIGIGAFAGGFVSGLAGFGTGLTALGFWLHVISPQLAATLVVVCSVVSQAQTLPTIWHAIEPARLWPFIASGLVGVPIGTQLLASLEPAAFKVAIGVFLILFSTFMILGKVRLRLAWGGRIADGAIGFAGGFLGGLAGLSGPLPTMWSVVRGWGKDERRAVFQVFNLTILAAALVAHAAWGLLTVELGRLVLLALPGTLIGAWLGARAYRRLSNRRFDAVVLYLLLLSGLTLVWSNR